MTIATSAEQIAVCEAISAWAHGARIAELVRADVDKPHDHWTDVVPRLAEFGLFAAALPDGRGGFGATFTDVAAMVEECGRTLVPGPIGPMVAAPMALASHTDEAAVTLREQLAAGTVPAVTPASVYADAYAPELRDGVVDLGLVTGFVDGAAVLTPLDAGEGPRWYLIPPGAAETEVAGQPAMSGTESVSHLRLSGLAHESLIAIGDGELVSGVLHGVLAAYHSGVARWCLDTAVDYAKVRTQFGAPIGSFQAVKHICADMLCHSEELTAVAWDVAAAVDALRMAVHQRDHAVEQLRLARLAADIVVADNAPSVAKDCIQMLGGIGFTFEHDAHLYLRSTSAARSVLATANVARRELAQAGLRGERREFEVDLSAVEHRRDDVRGTVAEIARAAPDDRRALLASSGYLMPHWPAPYGLAASPALQLLIDTEFERADVVRPDLVIGAWAIPTILEHGTDEQRERFVHPTLAGDLVWCQLFSEPEAGSDLAALRTRATRVDGGWRLDGQKIWTSQAHNANWGICLARTNQDAPKHKGITYFLVDMSSPGLEIRPLRELTGRANFNEVFLDGVFVPDDCVVGEVDGGWRLARTTLANERVAMGGSGLGQEMETLLKQVGSLGRPLEPAETARLGTLVAEAHVGRVIDARSVTRRLDGHDPGALSSVRKLIGVRHRQAVPEFALDLLGAGGVVASDVTDLFLQNRCLSIAGGTTQILRTAAAERILGLPRG